MNNPSLNEINNDLEKCQNVLEENNPLRCFEEIQLDALDLSKSCDSSEILAIVQETVNLNAIEKRRVFETLKLSTGIPLSSLNELFDEYIKKSSSPDQLYLAQTVINSIGRDNILFADSSLWQWQQAGVWKQMHDREAKQIAQGLLVSIIDKVDRSLVDGVTELLKNTTFKANHDFNIGDPETINCLNGELSSSVLGIWSLSPHLRENYRTTQLPINYDQNARAPKFERFLDEIFNGDTDANEKRNAVLEMMGYSLVAHCKHEKFIILIGSGANGKSVLLSVLEALAGRVNVAAVQPSQFNNTFQRAHLHGKLVNIVTELKQGAQIEDDALKGITSGEPTTVEHKNKDPFVMRPFSTCWFGTNHMPHTRDFSDALFRRSVLITFNNKFSVDRGNINPTLKTELLKELDGILNLALSSYSNALSTGFTSPESMKKAIQEWRIEADQVAQFVDEVCERLPDRSEKSSALFEVYQEWARANGIKSPVNNKTFKDRLSKLGIEQDKRKDANHYRGVMCDRCLKYR